MLFCIRRRELAVTVAGASDEAAADVVLAPVETGFDDGFFDGLDERVRDVRDDDVLPGGKAKFSGAIVVREFAKAEELFRSDFADGDRDAEPGEAGLLLREGTDVRMRDGGAERGRFEIGFPVRVKGVAKQLIAE